MGSPRLNGLNAQLIDSALQGAASKGAETKRYDLIKCNIHYCRGCFKCVHENHELPIGKCPLKDDMALILEEYSRADGYILTSPVYDVGVTALMKTFLERKFSLFYRQGGDHGKIPAARVPAHFKKKVSFIVTGNCHDEYKESMGGPCFEAMESDFFIEQIDTVDKLFVGGVDNMRREQTAEKVKEAFDLGVHLVDEIINSRNEVVTMAS
jgi:multimeric flavodoxin WrbA